MNPHIPNEDEEILVSKLKAGEEWAFDAIYGLYANRLFGQIVKFTRVVEPAAGGYNRRPAGNDDHT
ncbi:MAG: hypothetical protein J0H74_06340 [Chitinophagaceae bacterium]|nr:hypothetical protein [Chitinophagaceae bacterium]